MTMWQIVGSIVKNQAYGGKWLVSETIFDILRVYIYFSGDDMDEVFKVDLEHMVEEKDGLAEARQLKRNLEETHIKMWKNKKRKLSKYLEPLLEVPSSDNYHLWFALMLNPLYVN